ncbi:MAG: ribokinase [Chloroflexota bacterium]
MITIIGSANMDAIAHVASLPQPGETVLAHAMSRLAGGKGANQAVAAARAGSETWFIGRLGQDTYGRELRASLEKAGVITDHLIIDPENPTGMAMITVDAHGENSIVVIPGANGRLSVQDIERTAPIIRQSSVVVAQLEISMETVQRAAEIARDAGATFVLNPAPARPLNPELLRLVDVLIPNEDELARLSGLGSPIDAGASAHLMLDTGISTIVVTRGSEGALVVTRDGVSEIPAFNARAIDTTGAGDAFVGNLAHGMDVGLSLVDAARFASAAAALSVQHEGAQDAMPLASDTNTFLKENE